jgi:hypothetical protein
MIALNIFSAASCSDAEPIAIILLRYYGRPSDKKILPKTGLWPILFPVVMDVR